MISNDDIAVFSQGKKKNKKRHKLAPIRERDYVFSFGRE